MGTTSTGATGVRVEWKTELFEVFRIQSVNKSEVTEPFICGTVDPPPQVLQVTAATTGLIIISRAYGGRAVWASSVAVRINKTILHSHLLVGAIIAVSRHRTAAGIQR